LLSGYLLNVAVGVVSTHFPYSGGRVSLVLIIALKPTIQIIFLRTLGPFSEFLF
jgi:hypothetical protein